MPKTLVIIPVYNEEKKVGQVIQGVMTYCKDILVVDDKSTDNSREVVSKYPVHRIAHKVNQGKGKALISGFQFAIDLGYDYVVILDADGEHDPDELPLFLNNLNGYDLIIGQRRAYRSRLRVFLNYVSTFCFKFLIPSLNDVWCGYRAVKVDFLRELNFDSEGFEIEMELIMDAVKYGKKIKLIDITTVPLTKTHFKVVDYIAANNFFARWVLRNFYKLPINFIRKGALLFFAVCSLIAGLILEKPLLWLTNYLIKREERK